MHYHEYQPSPYLKPYIQCFFTCQEDADVVTDDKVYASGVMEVMFNLGEGSPQQFVDGELVSRPQVQLWGQTIRPFAFTSAGRHSMLGIRFFTHTTACFFDEPIATFNDRLSDFNDMEDTQARLLHQRLLEAANLSERLSLLEAWLTAKLEHSKNKTAKRALMASIVQDVNRPGFLENINSVAARYGLSSRYLQKLFVAYSGLSPALYSKISRFQQSLQLVAAQQLPLTTIAYKCGYYDQSHFIKDFKQFTGVAPLTFQRRKFYRPYRPAG